MHRLISRDAAVVFMPLVLGLFRGHLLHLPEKEDNGSMTRYKHRAGLGAVHGPLDFEHELGRRGMESCCAFLSVSQEKKKKGDMDRLSFKCHSLLKLICS